jgi:hypothetical protein
LERALLIPAAVLLLYTGPAQDLIGIVLLAVAVGLHLLRIRGSTPTLRLST